MFCLVPHFEGVGHINLHELGSINYQHIIIIVSIGKGKQNYLIYLHLCIFMYQSSKMFEDGGKISTKTCEFGSSLHNSSLITTKHRTNRLYHHGSRWSKSLFLIFFFNREDSESNEEVVPQMIKVIHWIFRYLYIGCKSGGELDNLCYRYVSHILCYERSWMRKILRTIYISHKIYYDHYMQNNVQIGGFLCLFMTASTSFFMYEDSHHLQHIDSLSGVKNTYIYIY